MPKSSGMRVLFAAAEAAPLIKVGGLGDVAGSLPGAIRKICQAKDSHTPDVDIRLVIPYHPSLDKESFTPREEVEFTVPTSDGRETASAYFLDIDGLKVYLVGGKPFDRETAVYSPDLEEDGYKYVFFSMAVLELARQLNWRPHILHANDWHTATSVYALGIQRSTERFFHRTASLLTVHNLPYLGSMTEPALRAFGLPAATDSSLPPWAQSMALPLGLLAADSIVAVSPNYAREILTEAFGSGLDVFLSEHEGKIHGILNGLDTVRWNPETDPRIATRYMISNIHQRLINKLALQQEMGLEKDATPLLLAMVSRLDLQKGVDWAISALRSLLSSQAKGEHLLQVLFLGTGDPALEIAVRRLKDEFPEQVCARIAYDEPLSHHIYAGADALLMPSRYEPCGLSQMIAMRYGCVPIASATGGLADTIKDTPNADEWTGFLFDRTKPEELAQTIQRARQVYSQDPTRWRAIQVQGMGQDFSWDRSAHEYLKQYQRLVGLKYYV